MNTDVKSSHLMNDFLDVVSAVIRPGTLTAADRSRKRKRQYAALAYRQRKDGIEVLLVTSRDAHRWVLPKGWPKKSISPHKLALLEAYEEAGVRGKIERDEIGAYSYIKRIAGKDDVLCRVGVFPMKVRDELSKWPEQHERERRWLSCEEAASMVDEPELAALLRRFKPAT